MVNKYVRLAALAVSIIVVSACSDDNPLNPLGACASGSWATEVANESSALSAAAEAYGNDPTVANCNAYKTAGTNYLNALESAQGCVVLGTQAAFDAAVADAQEDIDALDCSGS